MSSINTISPEKLARLVGTPNCPAIVDVRDEDDFAADPRLIPASVRRGSAEPWRWAPELRAKAAIVVCQKGLKLSHGVAAWLRSDGIPAEMPRRRLPGVAGRRVPRRACGKNADARRKRADALGDA